MERELLSQGHECPEIVTIKMESFCQGAAHEMELGTFHTPEHLHGMEVIFNTNASIRGICICNLPFPTLRIKQLIYRIQRAHPSLKENIL